MPQKCQYSLYPSIKNETDSINKYSEKKWVYSEQQKQILKNKLMKCHNF